MHRFPEWMTDGMLAYQMEDRDGKMYKKDCLHREEAERIRGRASLHERITGFWCRCVQGKHPYPSRTRRLRPERPMVLHWRRCGRAGGRQIKKRITGNSNECPVEINTGIGKRALSETKRNQKDIENLMLTPISREVLLRNWLLYQ